MKEGWMKRKRYWEEKIISILKEHEAGASVPDLARRHDVAENTTYLWKATFGGMDVSHPAFSFYEMKTVVSVAGIDPTELALS
jgi:hypothetical protein